MEDHLLNTAKEKLSELVKKNGLAEDASHLMCAVAMFAIK